MTGEARIKLTADQIAQLKAVAAGDWRAGRSSEYTNWSLRTMNLNTMRAFARKGLLQAPYPDGGARRHDLIYPGNSIEITQAGRDWLEENE